MITAPFHHQTIQALFSQERSLFYWIKVETALAVVQGELGVIDPISAEAIQTALVTFQPDNPRLQAAIEKSGVPIAELVRQLRQQVGLPHGNFVHFGATTQDIMDTALVMQLRAAMQTIAPLLRRLIKRWATLADTHRNTLMAGRTHSQQALPLSFGLKVANWLAPILRHNMRLTELLPRLLVVQFGGAAGTLSALGAHGMVVQAALADELGLGVPTTPWHSQRDNLVEFANWLALLSGSLAKMAQDVILMAQSEVAELRESADPTRGGSSTMPQKANPIQSEMILAAHRTNIGLLANMQQALVHEHERATGAWQVEWLNLPQMVSLTAAALERAVWLSDNLVVNVERMRANVAASNGVMLGEALNFALAPYIDRAEAKRLIKAVVQSVIANKGHLVDLVRQSVSSEVASQVDWDTLRDEATYLGSAEIIIDRTIAAANCL
ncbi:MAG: 3-carboxy-cis,cis-muconate cycloisomerase [Candidatus Promineifilaceae bacterium]